MVNDLDTRIASIEIRDLTLEVTRHMLGENHASYCVEIKLWPEDLLSEEDPQSLVLDFRNLLRLDTAVQQAIQAIDADRTTRQPQPAVPEQP